MSQAEQKSIKIEILGRSYALKVAPDDEELMKRAARFINERYREYRMELKGQPDFTINAMALLSIAVDLLHEQEKNNLQNVASSEAQELKAGISKILADIEAENHDI